MSTHIQPTHIGEPLAAALLQELIERRAVNRLRCHEIRDDVHSGFDRVLAEAGIGTTATVHDNVPLNPLQHEQVSYAFDGMSQVDCVIHGDMSMGIEIKLGTKRMATAEFTRRFCSPCGYTTHVPPRVRGSMIAVLDGRFAQAELGEVPLMAEVTNGEASSLIKPWCLVVRRQVFSQWSRSRFPRMMRPCWVIQFEDFVEAVGGPHRFNEIVLELVGENFAEAWGLV